MISSDKAGVQFPDSELSFAVVLDSGWMAFVQELSMAVLEGCRKISIFGNSPFFSLVGGLYRDSRLPRLPTPSISGKWQETAGCDLMRFRLARSKNQN
jgi:hypothetical protein